MAVASRFDPVWRSAYRPPAGSELRHRGRTTGSAPLDRDGQYRFYLVGLLDRDHRVSASTGEPVDVFADEAQGRHLGHESDDLIPLAAVERVCGEVTVPGRERAPRVVAAAREGLGSPLEFYGNIDRVTYHILSGVWRHRMIRGG